MEKDRAELPEFWKMEQVETYFAKIFIAGDKEIINKVCRDYTFKIGLCVNIKETTFIYTGGLEEGFEIELIQYARYPEEEESIFNKALALAQEIAIENAQWSFSIVTPNKSNYYTRRH